MVLESKIDILNIAKCESGLITMEAVDLMRGAPPSFWEVFNGSSNTGAVLQVLNEDLDGGFVIDRVNTSKLYVVSPHRNKNNYYRQAAKPSRNIRKLHKNGIRNLKD